MNAVINEVNSEGKEIAKEATDEYRKLAEYLLVRFMDGNMKNLDENGNFKRTEYGIPAYPSFPGYDEEYYRQIVNQKGEHFFIK